MYLLAVSLVPISKIPFPAITICPPSNGKWMAAVKGIEKSDQEKKLFGIINTTGKAFKDYIMKSFKNLIKVQREIYATQDVTYNVHQLDVWHTSGYGVINRPFENHELTLAYMVHQGAQNMTLTQAQDWMNSMLVENLDLMLMKIDHKDRAKMIIGEKLSFSQLFSFNTF